MSETLTARVAEKRIVAKDVFAFRLDVGPEAFIPAEAGAHIDVHLPGDRVRQYSLTRPADDPRLGYEIAVLRESGGRGGSLALCDDIEIGDRLALSAPRNHFALDPHRAHYVLLGAGIGLTPILAMARALHAREASLEVHVCARTPDHVPFKDEIDAAPWSGAVHYHFSVAPGGGRLDLAGFLSALRWDAQIYACGPADFLDAIDVTTAGWPAGRVRQERFVAADIVLDAADTGAFTVELKRSGETFTVGPDETILAKLETKGIDVPVSCTEGVCGTCLTGVVSGDLVHLDSCLYPEEQEEGNLMAVCVSRAKPGSHVVLDL